MRLENDVVNSELYGESFDRVFQIMRRLRAPGGCPWDRKQTLESLRAYIAEEAYELIEAIGTEDGRKICEEAGDLLLQVVFIACIAEETGAFRMEDILDALSSKLIRRHPHVFAANDGSDGRKIETSEDVLIAWEQIKAEEKKERDTDTSVLAGVPSSLPPLAKAFRIQSKAAHVGFDWPRGELSPVFGKVREELDEIGDAISENNGALIEDEVGDLLFAVVNLARHLDINPESALQRANTKFSERFRMVEGFVAESGEPWEGHSLESLDSLWERAKKEREERKA
jgi:XTP/dITP diphosphohydrolase/tetrapyrrole methylase family protein/MazG family protein/ATP diphosphatase